MCGSSAPPPPDPNIAIAANKQLELGQQAIDLAKQQGSAQSALGKEYLDFAKDQFKISTDKQDEFAKHAKDTSDFFTNMAKEDRDRWESVYKPLEDSFVNTAKTYDTPEYSDERAAAAKADVLKAGDTERQAQERRMQATGINPASGAYAGIDRAVGLGTAVASADAQNRARAEVRNEALALKGNAINLGRGLSASAGADASAGLNAAGQPLAQLNQSQGIIGAGFGGALTGEAQGAATTGAGFKTATSATGSAGDISNSLYKTNVSAWDDQAQIAQKNAAGIGQFAGTALGAASAGGTGGFGSSALGLMFLSSKKAKTNRKTLHDGAALDAVSNMPVQSYDYKPGMGDGGSHVGPMAEDFRKATGRGDGKQIAAQDAIGVTMGAVQDLHKKVNRIAKAVGIHDGSRRKAA